MTTDPFLDMAEQAIAGVASDDEARGVIAMIEAEKRRYRAVQMFGGALPPGPLEQALELDPSYRARDHLRYLSDRLTEAVTRVEAGESIHIRVSMPPRFGKTTLIGWAFVVWCLRKHPDWPIAIVSHESTLAIKSGRAVRRTIEADPGLGITIAPDAGAVGEWETTAGGGVLARGYKGSITGRGAKIMLLDDLVKDFVSAHSGEQRKALWEWWLTTGQTRLERPYLVCAIGTRWHEDDILGRLGSTEYEGNPGDWIDVTLSAFAEEDDPLGRDEGAPLLSPLVDETPEEASIALAATKTRVGSYAFSAMYQQRPSPAKGAIFDTSWWRYWTVDPGKVTDDDRVVLIDSGELLHSKATRVLESWDCAFKGTDDSDYVVGQLWVKQGVRRFLVKQHRARMTFTKTKTTMQEWATDHPFVYERLVEDKANGTAVIDVLHKEVEGMIGVNPTDSKQARARAVTPECEAGNVYLPHPTDPGNEWVTDLLSELREFDQGVHDDQVDSLTQALWRFRDAGEVTITVPGTARGGNPLVAQHTRSLGKRPNVSPIRRTR